MSSPSHIQANNGYETPTNSVPQHQDHHSFHSIPELMSRSRTESTGNSYPTPTQAQPLDQQRAMCPICHRGPFSVNSNGTLHSHRRCPTNPTTLADPTPHIAPADPAPPLAEAAHLPHLAAQDDHQAVLENIDGQARQEPLRIANRPGPSDRLYNRWLDELRALLNAASESRTKGDLDDAVAGLLAHAPPRATVLPRTPSYPEPAADNIAADPLIDPPTGNLRTMHKHFRNGDAIKARRAASGSSVGSVADQQTRELLATKYPAATNARAPPTQLELLASKQEAINHAPVYVEDTECLKAKIMGYKRGASAGPSGQSHDHFQDLLRRHPDAIHPLIRFCNLAAGGNLTDGPERMALLSGKGTILWKDARHSDVRPVVTQEPLWSYVCHMLARAHAPTITTICGAQQFMGVQAGCEIVVHTIRNLLESDHTLVVGKVDCRNAFNAIHKDPILEVVAAEAPALLPFADFLLNKSPIRTIFHDNRRHTTVIHHMEHGVPQGGNMSSALFNMGQTRAIRAAVAAHPDVHIILIADDTHIVGQPDAVIAAILDIRARYEAIGLSLAPTTESKNIIFGLGDGYTDQQKADAAAAGLHWLPPTHGLEIGGSPVGSPLYMSGKVNSCVDAIIDELRRYETFIDAPDGKPHARVQIIYALIRLCSAQQLTYLLRTTPPTATAYATRRLDAAVANTIYRITQSLSFLPPHDSEAMQSVLNRFFMGIRHGGDGFQATEDIRHAAYVASILQCAPSMHAYLPNGHQRQPTTTPSLAEFSDSVNLLRAHGVSCLTNIHFATIWHTTNAKMQRSISQELQQRRQQREIESLPDLPPVHGPAIHQPLSPDDAAIRRQGLTNCRCPESGSWLLANPALWINALSDVAFRMAFWLRSKFRVMRTRRWCICGQPVDCLGDHVLCCPRATIRNKVRNSSHAALSAQLRRSIQAQAASCSYAPATGEPHLDRYLDRRPVAQPTVPDHMDEIWNAPDRIERRADLILLSNAVEITPTVLVDVTMAAHNSQQAGPDYLPGRAAEARYRAKVLSYARDYRPPPDDIRLVFFAVETSGAIHHTARQFLHDLFPSSHRAVQYVLQSLSVAVQTARSYAVATSLDTLSMDDPPTFPYINGPIPPIPPPRIPPPLIFPRAYAVPPYPNRPVLV